MNTLAKVESMLDGWKKEGKSKTETCVLLANACLGWSYVFGARGTKCTPANRRAWYNAKGKETIKSKCKNFSGAGRCSGCKWYPGGVTLFYDCRGWTYWVFLKAAGIEIKGGGATSQYNDDNNWSEKGDISRMPKDKLCCVFRWDGKTMAHTLFYDGQGHYIHDNGEIRKVDMGKYAATHYAIPRGLYNDPTPPTPTPDPPAGKAVVTGKNVALRMGPSTSTTVQTRLTTGTTVDICKVEGWLYVKAAGKDGFMMAEYMQDNGKTATVAGKNVALREGPSTSAKVLARIATGKTVPKQDLPSAWEYVGIGARKGFMMKQYLNEG